MIRTNATSPNLQTYGFFGGDSTALEDHVVKVSEIDQIYRQVGRRSFKGGVRGLRRPEATIFRESTYPEVFQEGWLRWSGVVIVIPATASGDSVLCGHRVAPEHMAILAGNREFSFRTPSVLDIDVILVADALVRSLLGGPLAERVANQICVHPLGVELRLRIRAYIERLLGGSGVVRGLPASEYSADAHQRELVRQLTSTLLLEALPEARATGSVHRSAWVRAGVMRRALEFIHDHLEGTVDVLSVCHGVGVSRRHLQKSFESVLGVNPAEYMLRQRLLRARRILLERRGGFRNLVTAAAIESGFGHLGRFAAYYQRMFGESPRHTIGRHDE